MKIRCILLWIVCIASFVFANDMTPGSYAVSMKWDQGGNHYCRLAMYSFRTDYTIRSDYWQYNETSSKTCADSLTIGTTSQSGVPTVDSSYQIQGLSHFLGSNLSVRYGTWTLYSGGVVGITWSNGDEEYWRRTWYETKLTKIECYYADYADSPWTFYLYNNGGTFQRLNSAVNAGFGFGGSSTPAFTVGKTSMNDFEKTFYGLVKEWNGFGSGEVNVYAQNLGLTSFYRSSTGIERLVYTDQGLWVYAYLGIKGGSGMYVRRMAYQLSHDFDSNNPGDPGYGHIEDDRGHIMMGLQILDTSSAARGMVFCQTAPADSQPFNLGTISAVFYIDNSSTAAQTGICAN